MYRRRQSRRAPYRRLRRARTRAPTRAGAQRWQWGNFFASSTFQGPGGPTTTNVAFELASMEANHFNDPSTIAGAVQAITTQSMIKGIDIAGIVFSSGLHIADPVIDQTPGLLSSRFFLQQSILLDKKNNNTGIPVCANTPWHISTFPTNVVSVAGIRPDVTQEIRDYPSRILYRSTNYGNPLLETFSGLEDDILYVRPRTEVYSAERHRTLRIRRRITDDWGLYFCCSVWPTGSVASDLTWLAWISGSIYYRIVF